MASIPAIGVHNDLAAGEAAVGERSAVDETAGGVHQKDGFAIEELRWHDPLDDVFDQGFFDRVVRGIRMVLS